jgi:hypothetical protein
MLPINDVFHQSVDDAVTGDPEGYGNNHPDDDVQPQRAQDNAANRPERVPTTTTRSGRQVFLPSRYDEFVALDTYDTSSVKLNSLF